VPPIRPRRGIGWPRLKDHIFNVICSGVDEWYDYTLNWLAYMVQHPGEVGHTAMVLHGGHGIGKGVFAQYLLKMFGAHALHLRDSNHLLGRYNLTCRAASFYLPTNAFGRVTRHSKGFFVH
jgi:hypothetical protein